MIHIAAFPKCWLEDISEERMDLFDWIEQSAGLECEGLEMYSRFLKSQETVYLAEVRRRTEALGMCIPMLCHSPDFTVPDEENRKSEVKKQIELIRAAAELGGKFCRTLSGQGRPELEIQEGIKRVVGCIEECLPAAEECGVTLVMENHFKDGYWKYREFAQAKDVFLSLIGCIDSPHFGIQYDPSNAVVAGDDPIELLDAVLPRVRTMHASDRYLLPGTSLEDLRQEDGTLGYPAGLVHGVTGQGVIDYDAIFSRLTDIGFNGWISIEDGMNGMEDMLASVNFLKQMREKYGAASA